MFSIFKKKPKLNLNGENLIFQKGSKKIMAKYHMVNGKLHGKFEQYYLDGGVCSKAEFSNGDLHGLATQWSTMANCNQIEEEYEHGECIGQILRRGMTGALVHDKKKGNGDKFNSILEEDILSIINSSR